MGERQYIRSHRHSWWPPRPPWITLMTVTLFVNLANTSITCGPGIKSAGVTVPRGDIVIEYGSGTPLEITCVLDPDNEKVKSLFRNDSTDGGEAKTPSQRIMFYKNAERVSKQYMTIINATAAQLRISDPPAGLDTYYCTLLLDHQVGPNHSYDNISSAQLLSTPASDPTTFPTPPPTSLETSGPPSLVSQSSEVGVCLNSVAVGYKPATITNFSCISDNWVSLTCNWTKPENPIKTTYKLFFRLPGRAGGRTIINCPTDSDSRENTCYWDFSTTPIYRQPYEYYYFTLLGDNVLGNSTTPIRFHHYANVIPASPINITVVDKTQSSAMLRWSVGTMTAFPRELIHKIEYKSQWDSNPEHWHSVNVSDVCNSSSTSNQTNSYSNCRERDTDYYYFNVTDLKYPFTHYDFRIYVRSSVARGEDKWSPPGCITLKTKPSIPRRPPRTDVGSFECVTSPVDKSKRDVFIYWQNIEDNEKCGDSFEYRAYYTSTTPDNKTIIHRSNETYKNYAKFEGLSTEIGYNFTVYSSNKEGLSTEYSTIFVPNESNKLDEPLSFTKMAFDERGVFELSWKNASSQKLLAPNQVNDYTIFWCENDKDRPYQCNGYMNWMHIPSSESCYNITVSDHMKIYQFAISANSQSSPKTTGITSIYQPTSISSGMVWASCTVLHNKIVGKIKNVWVNMISSTSMELRWKLDCSDRIGAVLGFRIFYCPVVSINNSACKEPMLNKTVSGEMAQDSRGIASITDLKSYTTYMVTIALITKHGEGLHSDPLLNTTLEGAPDIQNLIINVTRLTNTTVSLQWSPPKFTNGVVRYYHIHYYLDDILQQQDLIDSFDEQQVINEQRRITVHDTKCRLDHLESYRSYTITITACTTVCSERSLPIKVRTAVGLPGRVSQPNLFYENSTRIAVSWPKPAKPAGPVDYYELIVAHHSGPTNSQTTNSGSSSPTALASTQIQENPNNFLYHSNSNVFRVPVPDCNNEQDRGQQTFSFAVRAVNNNPNDPHRPYYGQWSVPGSVSCVLPGLPLALHLVIWSCLFIVLSTVSTYWGNRLWRKYKVMHNVEVVLPPTLNINFKFDHYNNFGETISEPGQHYYVEDGHIIYDNAPADVDATTIAFYNGNSNVSSGSNRRKNSSANASSERLPSSRWSPATASTTITVADDDDSSSSKHQLIMPSSLPKTKSESVSDGNSLKSEEEEVLEVVPPTEPVLPFFSLPATPTITTAPTTGSIIRSGNGYQSTGNGYQSKSNGYQSTGNGYQSTGGNGYQSNGYGYQTNGNGYQGSNICQGVAKSRFVGDSRGDGVVAPSAVISCFVGDQRQSNDKNLRRCGGGNPSPAADVAREFLFPAAETVTDENRSHHEQASE
ncbi:cytokine receptor-like isoform X2 [Myzus persicae]|uniref:cytokine receptor-like isoform X2 n=1 Tax=Myzus persicae TaxID=13164 RepID=UPI000B935AFE|nr:cytokine receptor-like isoform X2 [Myzus persicae]